MSGKISARDIEEIKSRANIADIISEYVALRPASAGSLKGLCPFHDEKSPSFNVRPAQGFYHCFGCSEGGDVFTFLQQIERLSFTEAVEKLASRYGYEIHYEAGSEPSNSGLKARIYEANQHAAIFFADNLSIDEALAGRDFLKGRGFDKAAAELFGIGYAPKGWSNLTDYLKKKGFTVEELLAAGLASKGDKGTYDKFRGRLIWPIRDASNQVIGFGARKLYDDDKGPKYLNTSDTLVYHKSQVLYGIDLAKKAIAKQRQVVVVEGYTDVMACHLAGIETAVASCGTAFGDEHIRILNRMLPNTEVPAEVIFTFDPDAAGQKAAMRAFADSHKFNAQTFVAVGPEGLDPCDLRAAKGDSAVIKMIESKTPMFEYAIRSKIKNFDLGSIQGRIGAARAAATVIVQITDPTVRPSYIREVALWLNIDTAELSSIVAQAAGTARAEVLTGAAAQRQPASQAAIRPGNPTETFEQLLLATLIQQPALVSKLTDVAALTKIFTVPTYSAIYATAIDLALAGKSQLLNELLNSEVADTPETLRELAALELPVRGEADLGRFVADLYSKAQANLYGQVKLELLAKLRSQVSPDTAEARGVQVALMELENRRREVLGN